MPVRVRSGRRTGKPLFQQRRDGSIMGGRGSRASGGSVVGGADHSAFNGGAILGGSSHTAQGAGTVVTGGTGNVNTVPNAVGP